MPAADIGIDKNATGVYEICIAPSAPLRLYMAFHGFVYRSDDRGSHWARTGFANVAMNANDDFRTAGQKMAIDPANPDVVYVGTSMNGVFVTTDGGATWSSVSDIPKSQPAKNGQFPGHPGIAFDKSSGVTAGRTRIVYASSYGNGLYQSSDAGASWRRLRGGPENVTHGKVAIDGVYYAVGDDFRRVWRYQSDVWTNITPTAQNWATTCH